MTGILMLELREGDRVAIGETALVEVRRIGRTRVKLLVRAPPEVRIERQPRTVWRADQ
jgi:sRNA-binding carbon storage regulator CsrA